MGVWKQRDPETKEFRRLSGSGKAGANGGHYTPTVTDNGDGTVTFGWSPSLAEMPKVEDQKVELPAGPVGVTPKFTVGTVITGEAGADAAVSITGSDAEPVLRFVIPQGPDGYSPEITLSRYEATEDAPGGLTVSVKNKDGSVTSQKISDGEDGICTLPYGGSKEWLEANGDPAQLYQIDGYVWGYVESDGWTKSATRFLVVSSESQMVNQGGTGYLLRSGSEGTVYAYSEASGDKDVPVYDALPETANEGDIVAVGGRKYKATVTEKEVLDCDNLATTFEPGRFNSSAEIVTDKADATVCTDYISVVQGSVVRIKGFGALTDYRTVQYNIEKTQMNIGIANALMDNYATYAYDSASGIVTLTNTHAQCRFFRFSGVLTGTTDDVVITVDQEIKYKTVTETSWVDIGEYIAPVEAGWNATDETYLVIDSLSTTADNGESAVYSGDGYVYTYIAGAGWMAMSKYSPPTLSVDGELSDTSTKAVQNKVVKAAIDEVDAKATANANDIISLQNKVEAMGGGTSSDAVTIPSYWEDAVVTKTETIKALQRAGGKDCVCFAWASDTHIPDNHTGRTNDIGKVMAAMLDGCRIPFALISGDVASRSQNPMYPEDPTEEGILGVYETMGEHLAPLWGTDRLLVARGNHDGAYGDVRDESGTVTKAYMIQFPPELMWDVFSRPQALDFRRVFSNDGSYFYVDNIPQKTRFIVLNSHFGGEYAEDENGWAVNNRFATSCYGQAQLEWLANVALDMPEGYGAVITAHAPPNITYTVDKEQLIGIINAYCNKTTFSGSYTDGVDGWSNSTVDVDFTSAKGEIIAMFAGHIHWDKVDTTTLACPLVTIISAGASVNESQLGDGEVVPTRTFGTDTETSFDIVTINRATRTIYCTRVGAGEDREISY